MSGTTSNSSQPSALQRLVNKVNPPARPRYHSNCINKSQLAQPPLVSRVLTKYFPSPTRTDVPWYAPSIGNKLDHEAEFFAEATGCEGKELEALLTATRDKAWVLDQYPCFGRWFFLLPGISGSPWYGDVVVQRAKEGATVLDVGCGLGQEIRRVANIEGVNSSQLYALDVSRDLWDLGLETFGDASSPPATFIQADARAEKYSKGPPVLDRQIDVVLMGLLLDLFHFPDQVQVGKTIADVSKVGTQVIGYSRGTVRGKAVEDDVKGTGSRAMIHDDQSLKTLWFDVGELSKTKWKVEAKLVEVEELGWDKDDVSWMGDPPPMGLYFAITREE